MKSVKFITNILAPSDTTGQLVQVPAAYCPHHRLSSGWWIATLVTYKFAKVTSRLIRGSIILDRIGIHVLGGQNNTWGHLYMSIYGNNIDILIKAVF